MTIEELKAKAKELEEFRAKARERGGCDEKSEVKDRELMRNRRLKAAHIDGRLSVASWDAGGGAI